MIVETKYGNFEILKNEKDGFDLVKFEEKYLPEYFDKYPYLVGDLSDDLLRLKGFTTDSKSPSYFHCIPDYIVESCAYGCKYYILRRVGKETQEVVKEVGVVEPETTQGSEEATQPEDGADKLKQKKHRRWYGPKKKGGNK